MLSEISIITAAFCWALGASLYKKALLDMNPLKFNLVRSISVFIYAFLTLFLFGKWGLLFELDLVSLALIGVSSLLVLVAGDTLYFVGLRSIGVAKTVPIAYSYSILVILLSSFFLGEAITGSVVFGTIVIIFGVWLVAGKALDQTHNVGFSKVGVLAGLGTSIFWACGIVLFKIILMNNDPFVLAAVRLLFLFPTLGILLALPLRKKSPSKKWTKFRISLAFLSGLIGLGVGDTLLYFGLDFINTNIVAPLSSITPIFSAIIAMFYLREAVSKKVFVGTILVTAGTIFLFM
jgi:DME family drug/metabolite transporter